MPNNNRKFYRRQFLRSGLIGGVALLSGVGMLLGKGIEPSGSEVDAQMGISVLINALRSTGNAVCLGAADRLEASRAANADYDLHLRNAGLEAMDAEIIAGALRETSLYEGHALRSFSMSYNPGLTDGGIVSLAQAFPPTLTELGLVQCAIGDEGGAALLHWGQKAVGLRMICVEGNHFSVRIRQGFASLAQERTNLLVVI
jgi:hypothetical protein